MPTPPSFSVRTLSVSLARELSEQLHTRDNTGEEEGDHPFVTIFTLSHLGIRNNDLVASSTSLSSEPPANIQRNARSSLHFLALQNATTCESYSFSWLYDGPVLNDKLTFSVIQSSLDNYAAGTSHVHILTMNTSTSMTNFTWISVDLTQGWYILEGTMDNPRANFLPHMSPLYVANGTNTSCVEYSQPRMYGRPSLDRGDIAGIIVGAIAAAGLLAIAFIFPRLWRRDLPSLKKRRPYYLY